ncbi:hypothetical protein RhiirC2_791257 [Rhizophagus irregularis]|uniref:Uncharacterized protein n=1 Tax=Rhizophagus irregularis TaxID=588596 RepID=A0A2N1MJJ3_9GLOM|nr:hypothetical protein RhiirC2_791257 [Rhizophagus irregularis]
MARFTCTHIKKNNTICGNSGCEYNTDNNSGYCSSHSAKIYSHNYRMRQKRKAEGLQPEIPEAPISESNSAPEPPRIYEAPVSKSDDEDMGLDLFGD